ncbi:MAG TPA: hypothetical protein VEA36_02615 [Candidatus Paceibacterota bacterium]|nr:hypothetical protein [Candidatus Paceibacterota bacterium]
MKIFIAHASNFDFKSKVYEPLRNSALNEVHEFIFPQEQGVEVITKDVIKGIDLLIFDASVPSTGAGIELGWADAFSKRVICIHEQGARISSSIPLVTDTVIEYSDPEDLVRKLTEALDQA